MSHKKINDLNVKAYSVIQNMLYCLQCTIYHYPLLLVWCVISVFIHVSLPILTIYLPKVVIDAITQHESVQKLIFVVLLFTISIAVLIGLKKFFEHFIYQHKYKMNSFYMKKIANKGMTTDYHNQEKEQFRKLQMESYNSCNGHYSQVSQIYDTGVALFSNVFGFAVYFGILTQLNVWVVAFLVATILISYLLNKQIIQWAADHNNEKIGYQQKTNYINRVSGDIQSAKDIRLYNMATWLENVHHINIKALSGWYKRYASKIFKTAMMDGGLSFLREGVAYAYLLYLVFHTQMSVADFVLYFGVITGFSVWLSGILEQVNSFNRISLSINYLRSYLEYPESYQQQGGKETADILDLPKQIEFKNVSYRYEGAEEDTLRDINLIINPKEHLAVVGLNGAGKTTLVKLICGLCDPTSGVVLYDGVDVREYNRKSYYKLFSAVFQQFSILPVTVEEIIAESTPENIDTQKVAHCLAQSGIKDKVMALPKGLQSAFGKTVYDDGVEFSGGEIQKLVLARALYKNSPIIILDEPTAALDPISESRLYETYHAMMKEKSTLFISHRLASTRFCSRILLLENGIVLEEGTHETLLALKGKYYNLFETQAKYYREDAKEEEGWHE